VYWVRRLLVLGLAVALVWGTTSLFGGNGDDARQAAAEQGDAAGETTTTPTTPPPTTADTGGGKGQNAGPRPRPGGATRPQVVPATLPSADGGCLAADVTVTPSVPGTARSGTDVALALSVGTTGATVCRLELSPQVLAVKVSTGGQQVWDTVQCPGAVPERTAVLRPGWTTAVTITWPGVYGDKGCTGTTKGAPPGAYALEAAVYKGEPGRTDFELMPPVAQTPDGGPRGHDEQDGHHDQGGGQAGDQGGDQGGDQDTGHGDEEQG
jgi:hypothetical protein